MSTFRDRVCSCLSVVGRARKAGTSASLGYAERGEDLFGALEPRLVLAAVMWDGGAGTSSWHDAGNWSVQGEPVDRVPGPMDDVTINVAANPTIFINTGNQVINSLNTSEAIEIRTNGTLSVLTTATFSAPFALPGGTLAGGTYISQNDAIMSVPINTTGRLSGVVLRTNLNVSNNADLVVSNGLTLDGSTITLQSGANASRLFFNGNQTINGGAGGGGAGAIVMSGVNAAVRLNLANDPPIVVTIESGITISGRGIIGDQSNSNTLLNRGTILANVAGADLTISPSVLTNQGTIRAMGSGRVLVQPANWTSPGTLSADGGTLATRNNWSHTGSLQLMNSGTLDFGGSFTLAGSIQRTGGTAQIIGTLTGPLNLAGPMGTWEIRSEGTISGGEVFTTLLVPAGQEANLAAAILREDITVENGAALDISGGLTFSTANLIIVGSGTATRVFVNGTQTIGGTGEVRLTGNTAELRLNRNSIPQTTVTVESGVTIVGRGLIATWTGNNTFVNRGRILANVAAADLTVGTNSFMNEGAIESTGAARMLVNATMTTWLPGATILADNGTIDLSSTNTINTIPLSIQSRNSARVNFNGAWDNTGRVITIVNPDPMAGSVWLNSGSMTGGSLVIPAGSRLSVAAYTLNSAAVNGDLLLPASGGVSLTVNDGLTLNGQITLAAVGSALIFNGGSPLAGTGTIFFDPTLASTDRRIEVNGIGTLTLGPAFTIRGGRGIITTGNEGSLINQGTILADQAGTTITVNILARNSGTLRSAAGDLVINSPVIGSLPFSELQLLPGSNIRADGGSVNFVGGNIDNDTGLAGLSIAATTNVSMGRVIFSGGVIVDNTGATMNLDAPAAIGVVRLQAAEIVGGVINETASTAISPNSGVNRLFGVTINGDLDLSDDVARLFIFDGLTLNGIARLSGTSGGSAAAIVIDNSLTINGNATIEFVATRDGPDRFIDIRFGSTLTLAPSVTVRGGRGAIYADSVFGGLSGNLINQGTINADVQSRQILIQATSFINAGSLRSTAAGSVLNVNTASTFLAGTQVVADSGRIDFSLAAQYVNQSPASLPFSAVNNGQIRLIAGAQIINAGRTIQIDAQPGQGSFRFENGTIDGGTVNLLGQSAISVNTSTANSLRGLTLNGNLQLSDTNATLVLWRDVTLNGTATLSGPGASLDFVGGVQTLAGNASIVFDPTQASTDRALTLNPGTFLTLAPTVTVRGGRAVIAAPSGGVLSNMGTIAADATGQALTISSLIVLSNTGVLQASNGGVLNVFSNNTTLGSGTLLRASGIVAPNNISRVVLGEAPDSITNASAAPLDIQAASGGEVRIGGTLFNVGRIIQADAPSGGGLRLEGGRIDGGVINLVGTTALTASTSASNRLSSGVTVNGNILLGPSTSPSPSEFIEITGGLTLNGTATLAGAGSELRFNGGVQSLSGNATIVFDPASASTSRFVRVSNAGTLTLTPTVTIRGGLGTVGQVSGGVIVNQGIVSADVASRDITINPTIFWNSGTLRASSTASLTVSPTSSLTLLPGSLIRGSGGATVNIQPGTTINNAGTLPIESTGAAIVNLNTNLVNTGAALSIDAPSGTVQFIGGSVRAGTINITQASRLLINRASDVIVFTDAVTVNGEIEVVGTTGSLQVLQGTSAGGLTLNGTARLSASGARILFSGGVQSFNGNATVIFDNAIGGSQRFLWCTDGCTLTIASSVNVRGGNGQIGFFNGSNLGILINRGRVSADVAGQTISLSSFRYTTEGIVEAMNGGNVTVSATGQHTNYAAGTLTGGTWRAVGNSTITFDQGPISTNSAAIVLSGAGSVFTNLAGLTLNTGSLTVTDGRTYAPSPAGSVFTNAGTLSLGRASLLSLGNSTFVQTTGATFAVELAGINESDNGRLATNVGAAIAGTLAVTIAPGFSPMGMGSVRIINAASLTGTFGITNFPASSPVSLAVDYTMSGVGDVFLNFQPAMQADWNMDGFVNSQDFFDFISCLFDVNCDADFNLDGSENSQDFFDFLSVFFS